MDGDLLFPGPSIQRPFYQGYTENDVAADLTTIAKSYRFIRTYAVQHANRWIVKQASASNLQEALRA